MHSGTRIFSHARTRQAFTLVELLVVIAIIAILAAIIFPVVTSAINRSHQATSANNLRQWYVGIRAATSDRDNRLPSSGFNNGNFDPKDQDAWFNCAARKIPVVAL